MFLLLLCVVFAISLFGSNSLEIYSEHTIFDLPQEIRLEIANFLHTPSEKYLLFSKDEQNNENFYYDTVLKKNLDDVIRYTAVNKLRLQNYKHASKKNRIFFDLSTDGRLEEKLNSLYNAFVTTPRNFLKYCHESLFDSSKQEKLNKLCPEIRTINSRDLINFLVQEIVITTDNDTIVLHNMYGDPLEYINTNIITSFNCPCRLLLPDMQHKTQLFFLAIEKDNVEIVKLLAEAGADVNARNEYGGSPLYYAIEKGNIEMVKLLIQARADVNTRNEYGKDLLCYAIEKGNIEMVKLLIQARADVNARNEYGGSPLCYAIEKGNIEMVKLLIQARAGVNARNEYGGSPLYYAIKKGNIEMVKLLTEVDADIDTKIKHDKTLLDFAVEKGNAKIVKLLIKKVEESRIIAAKKYYDLRRLISYLAVLVLLLSYPENKRNTFSTFISRKKTDIKKAFLALKSILIVTKYYSRTSMYKQSIKTIEIL